MKSGEVKNAGNSNIPHGFSRQPSFGSSSAQK
jgi:hypothetical protein